MGLEKTDWSPLVELCERINVPYEVRMTDIGDVIFNQRKEPNPCALCSKMRRGALTDYCKDIGANKLALGHHRDDAIETLAMSLLFEGRLHTFHPVTHLSRQNITQIRPMAYLPEKDIIHATRKFELPVTKSPCPANGETKREEMKELIRELDEKFPNIKKKIFGAIQRYPLYGWSLEELQK
jgi:tRNA(Ile)-lysidine synthase TilS/MesJ